MARIPAEHVEEGRCRGHATTSRLRGWRRPGLEPPAEDSESSCEGRIARAAGLCRMAEHRNDQAHSFISIAPASGAGREMIMAEELSSRKTPSIAGGAASLSTLRQPTQTYHAKNGRSFLVALVDGDAERCNVLRQRLDALGHASLAFDTLEDLLSALRAARHFGCVMVTRQGEGSQAQLEAVLSASRAPLLLVTLDDSLGVLSDIGESLLGSGGVDIVPLSCSDRELEWRLQLLLLRTNAHQADGDILVWGPYRFDTRRRLAWVNERKVSLQPLEFELALEFFRHLNTKMTRKRLYTVLWGASPSSLNSRKLDACVSNVRRKMGLESDSGYHLRSIYRYGYELNEASC